MRKCMLTTNDNPFNPFKEFDSWYMFDMDKGYNSCGYLARILPNISDELTDDEHIIAVENAIDEIINNDFVNLYKKVFE